MNTLSGFDYIAMHYDDNGKPKSTALAELLSHVKNNGVTDVLLIVHGFRNDEQDASLLYQRFLANFRTAMSNGQLAASMSPRKFAVGGIFWPSKAFSEGPKKAEGGAQSVSAEEEVEAVREQLSQLHADVRPDQQPTIDQAVALVDDLEDDDAQDKFVALVLSLLDDTDDDHTEGLPELKAQRGSELLDKLSTPIILPTVRKEEGGTMSVSAGNAGSGEGQALAIGGFLKTAAGKVGHFLNLATWYMMKNRSGTVGAHGVAAAVRELKKLPGNVRVHLIGHSLGGRCVAAAAKSLSSDPVVQPDSLSLLEAAFSHYGLSADNGRGERGFFRDVIDKSVVRGPFLSTYSYQDTVVGTAYAISSRLSGDNTKATGDKDDQFGGIGRNGTQRTNESTNGALGAVGTKYAFAAKKVNNLDGSGGLIKNHSDVTNAEVTYAVACAVAAT